MVVRLDTALPGLFQTGGAVVAHGVGLGAQGHDHCVHFHLKLAAGNLHRAAASGSVRLTQLHPDAGDGGHTALLVALDAHRIGQQVKDNALFLGVVNLLQAGG